MKQRGLTLIELTIALTIVALLFAAVVTGMGSITGSQARASVGEMGGVIRSLYDTSALTGKTCRLVFQLPDPRDEENPVWYWAECASGNITTRRDRDEVLREESKKLKDPRKDEPPRSGYAAGGSSQPTLQELMAQERERVESAAKFSIFTTPEIAPRQLPKAVHLAVWTKHQREAWNTGIAYLYFFPQGFTEQAMLFFSQGRNTWTLLVSPLTGKTQVAAEQLEVPRS